MLLILRDPTCTDAPRGVSVSDLLDKPSKGGETSVRGPSVEEQGTPLAALRHEDELHLIAPSDRASPLDPRRCWS